MDYFFPQTSIVHACFFRYKAVSNKFRSYLDVGYQLLKSLFSTLNTNGARYRSVCGITLIYI